MPGSIKIDDGSGNYTILTNAGSLGSDKTITIPNETGTAALTSGVGLHKLYSVTASNQSSVDLLFANTGWTTANYHSFIIKGRWITPVTDNVRLYGAFYNGSSLNSGTYSAGQRYYRMDSADSGYGQDNDTDFFDMLDGTYGTDTREGVQVNIEVFPSGDGTTNSSPSVATFATVETVAKMSGASAYAVVSNVYFDSASAVNGFKFYNSSGNINTGHFDFYGVQR
jgi:hypothetical protein